MRVKKRNPLKAFFTFRWLVTGPVWFYKKCVSPLLPNVCRYHPSCSAYMLDAVAAYGPFKGAFIGLKRLLRCVPWAEGGYDPVPSGAKGVYKWLY